MLMTLSDDECDLRIVGALCSLTQAATSFQGPSSRRVAPEERRRERGRKPPQAIIKVVYQSDFPNNLLRRGGVILSHDINSNTGGNI
jgi:hypothetical protein